MIRNLSICAAIAFVVVLAKTADAEPKTWTVSPGQSIQEAIDQAAAGDVVQVLPGEYVQTIKIEKDDITLKGLEYEGEKTVLKSKVNEEDEPLDTAIELHGKDLTLEGFGIQGFERGIFVNSSEHTIVRDMSIEDIQKSAVSIVMSKDTTVDHVSAGMVYGAAIYLQESTATAIRHCEIFASGAGIMIGKSQEVTVSNSSIHHNWMGVIVSGNAPDVSAYIKILSCRIMGNNWRQTPRIQLPPDDAIAGIGISLQGASHTEIAGCIIAENGTFGIFTASHEETRHLPKDAKRQGPPSEHTYIHHNRYFNNGGAPFKSYAERFPGIPSGDLYWDELGERNQFQENAELKTYPEKLVVKQGGVHTDVIHFQ